jgi:hypothetical protein
LTLRSGPRVIHDRVTPCRDAARVPGVRERYVDTRHDHPRKGTVASIDLKIAFLTS